MALPQYQNAAKQAREAVLKEDLFQFRKLIDQYYQDKGKYPASLQTLVDEKYLRTIPVDPMTNRRRPGSRSGKLPSPEDPDARRRPRRHRRQVRLGRQGPGRHPLQHLVTGPADAGYVLIILIMAVLVICLGLIVAVPVWQTEVQREKEEELIFRGRQYVEAVRLFSRRTPASTRPA